MQSKVGGDWRWATRNPFDIGEGFGFLFSMYIAMNRFRIALGFEDQFEEIWRNRESHLDEVPGFREFHLLRGAPDDEGSTFISHSTWDSGKAFDGWVNSDHFKRAHARARSPEGMHLRGPQFEGYAVVL